MRDIVSLSIGFSLLVGFCFNVHAQEMPTFTHYAQNRMLYNPAVVGVGKSINIATLTQYFYFKDQTPLYNGLPISSKNNGSFTNLVSVSAPLTQYGGIGVTYINDKVGYEFKNHVKINLAVKIPIRQGASIGIGTELNFLEKGVDGSKLISIMPDPSIPTKKESQTHPHFGAGIYYTDTLLNSLNFRDLWISASSLNLNSNKYMFNNGKVFFTTEREFHAMAGVSIIDFLGSPSLKLHPSIKGTLARFNSFDITALAEINNKFTTGIAYRIGINNNQVWSLLLGFNGFENKFKSLRIGYSYAINPQLIPYHSGLHELRLNFSLNPFY